MLVLWPPTKFPCFSPERPSPVVRSFVVSTGWVRCCGWSLAIGVAMTAAPAGAQPPPPPPQGYPPYPYPYYPPPPYPQPYAPAPPPPPAPPPKPSGPPAVVYGWDPDAPAPEGYRLASDPNGTMIGVGIALLTVGWTTSTVAAAVGGSLESEGSVAERDGIDPEDWAPLYIPVGGPIAAIVTLRPGPSGIGLLLADTIVQLGGLVGIVAGALDVQHKVVRTQIGGAEMELTPMLGPNESGLSLRGRF